MKKIVPFFFLFFATVAAAQYPDKLPAVFSTKSAIVNMNRVEQVKLKMSLTNGRNYMNLDLTQLMAAIYVQKVNLSNN